ncbi:MAG TPA: MazG nucleotide pyrophosphohydrolase domain-containing protein, partial [Rubrobacteraceae bacterium]|nr:MazG nucleotide pyrophosphohydrolase domain-containing protein [Rubrobacteraceae bacterium]
MGLGDLGAAQKVARITWAEAHRRWRGVRVGDGPRDREEQEMREPRGSGPGSLSMQGSVAAFVAEYGLEAPIHARTLDFVSEVGELAKEILEGTDYGRTPFDASERWTGELGDALFALVCLANSTGVDLEAALNAALEKYRERLALGGDAGSGR